MKNMEKYLTLLNGEVDGLLLTSRYSRHYSAEFDIAEGVAIVSKKGCRYFTDSRYIESAENGIQGYDVLMVDQQNGYIKRLTDAINDFGITTLGYEEEFLTAGEPGRYVEIQAGLAHTQYECLPMPPLTAWEWVEAYGALSADPARVHGDWDGARDEVRERLEVLCPAAGLDSWLENTRAMAKRPAERVICSGSGWGALENLRRARDGEPLMCPQLDFGQVGAEQADWVRLLECGTLAPEGQGSLCPPASWMFQREWTERVRASADCHEKQLHLAAIALADGRLRDAGEAVAAALALRVTPTALFLRAQVERLNGDDRAAADSALEAHRLLPGDVSLARQAFAMALRAGMNDRVVAAYEASPAAVQADGRTAMTYAFALLRQGDTDRAEAVLMRDGGLSVTDIREGEISLTNLYLDIARARADAAGRAFDPAETDVPRRFDFRMFVPKKRG